MLQDIRDNIQGTIAKVIIALICIPFVLFGVESLVTGGGSNEVANINGVEISEQQLLEATELRKRQLINQMGENLDPAMLEDARLRSEALDGLVNRELLLQQAHNFGIVISKEQLDEAIIQNPDFQEDGKFSNDLFRQRLLGAGFNTEIFTRLFRNDLLVNQLASGFVQTGFVTSEQLALTARFSYEKRDIRYITLDIDKAKDAIKPTNEDLLAYYDANKDSYKTDEFVSVEYIELKQSDFVLPVDETAVQDAYQQELAARTGTDQREISHLLLEVNADRSREDTLALLNEVKEKLKQGASFSDLVKEYSEDLGTNADGGYLGVFDETVFPPEFAPALAGLNEGDVSEVVETDSGMHLVQLTRLVEDNPPTFEERKEALKEQLAIQNAQPEFWNAVESLKNESFNAADLAGPSEAVNSPVKTEGKVTRAGGKGIFTNPQVVSALYSEEVLQDQQNSEVIELDPEHVIVVRVKEHNLPKVLPFDEVEGRIANAYKTVKAREQLEEKAKAIEEQLITGGDVEAIAKKDNDQWQLLLSANRNRPSDREIVDAAFKLPAAQKGQRAIDTVSLSSGNVVVMAVNNVQPGKLSDMSEQEQQFIKQYLARALATETFQEFQQRIKDQANIELL